MNTTTAHAIINDQDYIQAFLHYRRKPMETNDDTFRLAMDWCQAQLTLSASKSS
tara:strand:+ start:479 stop:640 length:162 start_codon:yes stop_codon:yes gene_type:complete